MRVASLRSRIRNGALVMLAVAVVLGLLALPAVHRLGRGIRATLYRNYLSIEAAQHMHAALWATQLAQRDGRLAERLPLTRSEFTKSIDFELHDATEPGEAQLAADIDARGRRLFDELAAGDSRHDDEFEKLHGRLDELIEINHAAMFRADSRAIRMAQRLDYELAGGLGILLLVGVVLSWTLAWTIAKPLDELAEGLRSFTLRDPSQRLGKQGLAELDTVATEFNRMAERLAEFERLNVDRLIYEKSKTEAIIESLEDGVVLVDSEGIVAHINEVASIILAIEPAEALGSRFDDLSSNSPHYLKVRDALRGMSGKNPEDQRVELGLKVRGRDHWYVLKAVPLRRKEVGSLGTILILQDVTQLRDLESRTANKLAQGNRA